MAVNVEHSFMSMWANLNSSYNLVINKLPKVR